MRHPLLRLACLAAPLAGLAGGAAAAENGAGPEKGPQDALQGPGLDRARPRLIAETASIAPGQTILIGVTFDIERGWHTYWNGRNDTVPGPWIEFSAPEGFEVGELRWPAPRRHESPGRILDHTYEGRVTIVAPLTAPVDLPEGLVGLEAQVDWTVCSDICLLANGTVRLDLAVSESPGAPGPEADRFAATRARLPRAPTEADGLSAERPADRIEIRAPGAERLAFYPAADGPELGSVLRDGAAEGEALTLRTYGGDEPLTGVLEIWKGGAANETELIELRVTGGGSIEAVARPALPAVPGGADTYNPERDR